MNRSKLNKRTALAAAAALAATLSSASSAMAQPGADGGDGEVSQINGVPVKVGEHNEYYYSFPRTNVSTNPLGALIGIYNVSISHAITNRIALRGDANVYDIVDTDESGYEFGIGLPIYFKHMYQGFFLEPGVIARGFEDDYDYCDYEYDCNETSTTVGPQLLAGYHWRWDSGFNVAAAMGVGRDLSEDGDGEADPFFNGYFRVGYAF